MENENICIMFPFLVATYAKGAGRLQLVVCVCVCCNCGDIKHGHETKREKAQQTKAEQTRAETRPTLARAELKKSWGGQRQRQIKPTRWFVWLLPLFSGGAEQLENCTSLVSSESQSSLGRGRGLCWNESYRQATVWTNVKHAKAAAAAGRAGPGPPSLPPPLLTPPPFPLLLLLPSSHSPLVDNSPAPKWSPLIAPWVFSFSFFVPRKFVYKL